VTKTYTSGNKKGKTYTVEELRWYDEDIDGASIERRQEQ